MRATLAVFVVVAMVFSFTGLWGAFRHNPATYAVALERLQGGSKPPVAVRDVLGLLPSRREQVATMKACAQERPNSEARCYAAVRSSLVMAGRHSQRIQSRYLLVLRWSRVFWGTALLLSLVVVYRAYDQIRRSDRRRSRPSGPPAPGYDSL